MQAHPTISKCASFSQERILEVKNGLQDLLELPGLDKITIYVTGSYGRGEARSDSDLDLFFLHSGSQKEGSLKRITEFELFSRIINLAYPVNTLTHNM